MAFFEVTLHDGKKRSVNTETIRYCEDYDRAAMHADLLRAHAVRQLSLGGLDGETDLPEAQAEAAALEEEFQEALASLDQWHSVIHFVDANWMAARETPAEVRQLANAALSALQNSGVPPQRTPAPFSFPHLKPG